MTEELLGFELFIEDRCVVFAGLSLNSFTIGVEIYSGRFRVNFGPLTCMISW